MYRPCFMQFQCAIAASAASAETIASPWAQVMPCVKSALLGRRARSQALMIADWFQPDASVSGTGP